MKGLGSVLKGPFWRHDSQRTGYQHLNYPTERARRLFYYVPTIGEARPLPGFRHFHRDEKGFLLHFVLRGEFWHRAKGKLHVARANDCVLLDLTEPMEYGNDGLKPAHILWAHVDGVLMPAVFRELRADVEPLFCSVDRPRVEKTFRELTRLTAGQADDYEPRASTLISALLECLFASRSGSMPLADFKVDPARLSEPVREALARIARFHMQPMTIKALAAGIGISRFHLSRLFRRETGFTPSEYLNLYRLEAARDLLKDTDKPIAQIARSVGIPNAANFSKFFRRRHGLSPRSYRAKKTADR